MKISVRFLTNTWCVQLLNTILVGLLGLAIALVACWFAGENPFSVFKALFNGAFGSRYDLGMTLFYCGPLLFTGLSVALAFKCGLFNIGAEGQLTIGALATQG